MDVDGEVVRHGKTGDMIFSVTEIAFASRLMTLEPGDVIHTGTPSGVGLASGRFLKDGDEMTALLAGLVNRVRT